MIVLYVILAVVAMVSLRGGKGFVADWMDRRQTDAVKGFFIGCVWVSHVSGYLTAQGVGLDWVFQVISGRLLGQLIVVMFLFYSGYGVMRAIVGRGQAYVRTMPVKRVLGTLVNFVVAVLAFFVLNLAFGKEMGVGQVLGALVGWDSLHNSNWYIFDILCCYGMTWAAARWLPVKVVPWVVAALCLAFAVALSTVKGTWWYNTVMAYPFGLMMGVWRDQVAAFAKRYYWWCWGVVLVGLGTGYAHVYGEGLGGNVQALWFACAVLLVSLKVTVWSPVLAWMGTHLFPIYIYQRLPMNVMEYWHGGEMIAAHPVLFVVVALVATWGMAALYPRWEIRLGRRGEGETTNCTNDTN